MRFIPTTKQLLTKRLLSIAFVSAVFFGFFVFAPTTEAASLYFSPSDGTRTVGSTFSVGLFVESNAVTMNAAGIKLSYDSSMMEIVSITDNGLIDFWAQPPSYGSGYGSFEGVSFTGYRGSSGRIVTLNIRPKQEGSATIRMTSGEVLEHDGLGTPIAHTLGSASFTFVPPKGLVPGLKPVITSETHPEQTKWFSNDDPRFAWQAIDGVHTVGVEVSNNATSTGDFEEQDFVDTWELTDVEDGTHYIHVRFENDEGFGETGSFRFNVDTVAPYDVAIDTENCGCSFAQKLPFVLTAKDDHSGVSHFVVYVDGELAESVPYNNSTSEAIFITEGLGGGSHVLEVHAFDYADNSTIAHHVFNTPYWWVYYCAYISLLLLLLLLIALIVIYLQRRQNRMLRTYMSTNHKELSEAKLATRETEQKLMEAEQQIKEFKIQAEENLRRAELAEETKRILEAQQHSLQAALISQSSHSDARPSSTETEPTLTDDQSRNLKSDTMSAESQNTHEPNLNELLDSLDRKRDQPPEPKESDNTMIFGTPSSEEQNGDKQMMKNQPDQTDIET